MYAVPLVRPVTVADVTPLSTPASVHDHNQSPALPVAFWRYCQHKMLSSPGSDQLSATLPLPAVADTPVGAAGTVSVRAVAVTSPDQAPVSNPRDADTA